MSKQRVCDLPDFVESYALKTRQILGIEENRARVANSAYSYFKRYHGCAQSMMQAFVDVLELRDASCFKALGGLQGGGGCGLTCGALNTGFVLLSLKIGRGRIEEGMSGMLPVMESCQRLAKWFKLQYKSTVCSEISGCDWFNVQEVIRFGGTAKGKERFENCAILTGGTAYRVAEMLGEFQ